YGGLQVGHAVVEAEHLVRLEDDFRRAVSHGVGNAHAVLPPQPEAGIPFRTGRRDHPAVAGRNDLARMERKTGDVAVRFADSLPPAIDAYLAPDRAGGILDDPEAVASSQYHNRVHLARHAELMHAENRPGAARDRRLDGRRIHVERRRLDVDEHGGRTAVPDGVPPRDERGADGNDFLPGAHAPRP